MDFTGKVAIVTGGAGGIGREVAALLGSYGASVVIGDICEKECIDIVGKLRAECIRIDFLRTDVSEIEDIRALMEKTIAVHQRLDILVNCAGVSSLTGVPDITPAEWDRILAVNLKSTFFCSQQALKTMCQRRSGKIINIASASGKIGGVAVGAHYAASKAAVICLTKSLALYAAPFKVNVNCVCPGPVYTPMTEEWGEEINTSFTEMIPFKRYAAPREVAETVGFLASESACYITGETIDVNGGLVMD
jgi:3-oxoacyl-[acyl-carrier protein] reductase